MNPSLPIFALASAHSLAPAASAVATTALPSEIVWMPAGEHAISAFAAGGGTFEGTVICDESGARAVAAQLAALQARGLRVFLDQDHKDEAATAWVLGFRWDPARGILARVRWTSLGEQLLRGKVYYSFSPAFLLDRTTHRVAGFPAGHAAGGLVNAPAFGAAMPALVAARGASAASVPGSEFRVPSSPPPLRHQFPTTNYQLPNPTLNSQPSTLNSSSMKDQILAVLAALAVPAPADASEEQLLALLASHRDQLAALARTSPALGRQLDSLDAFRAASATTTTTISAATTSAAPTERDELLALRAREALRRSQDARRAVDSAVARGALPPRDTALQARWAAVIESEPAHAELLAALPGSHLLTRVTEPGGHLAVEVNARLLDHLRGYRDEKDPKRRGAIYARHIEPEVVKLGNEVLAVMAGNSLGSLSSNIILQRYLSLLKFRFPFLKEITTDFSDAGAKFGQTIVTRLRSVPTVRDYDATTGYATRSDATTTDVTIAIDKHKYAAIEFKTTDLGATARDLFGEQAEPQLYALGYQFVSDLLALIAEGVGKFGTAGSQATQIANAAAFNAATLDTIAATLDGRKVAPTGRFALLDSTLWPQLRGDTRLVYLAGFQDRSLVQSYDTMPPVSGFNLYNTPFLPGGVAVNTSKVLHGFCGTAESLAVATRLPSDYTQALPGASNGVVQTIVEPDTGLAVSLVQYVNHDLGSAVQRVALMYGAAVGNPATGQLIAY